MTNNINHFKEIVDNAWIKHSKDQFRAPTAQDMEILIQTCLMPLAIKTQNDSFKFVHELKQEMHADLKYVESLENEIDKLESDKAEFSDIYDVILQECVSNDVKCSYLQSLSDLDTLAELQCMYLHKVKEWDCLAQKLSKQTESVNLRAQLQDKNIAISELKKLIEKGKGKSVDTKFDRPSVIRQPNAQRIPKPSVLGKPAPFSNSIERIYFPKTKSVPKANVSEGLSKPVTAQTLPQIAKQALILITLLVLQKMLNDVHARTKKPKVVPISTKKPKSQANKSVATSHKKHVASKSTKQKPHSYFRMMYENTSKAWKWWIEQQSPSGYKWVPKTKSNGFLSQKCNGVYYVEGLNHNLLSVGQFCDADLEVAFRKSTCFVRDLQGNDLLTDNRGSDLYIISLQELTSSTPLYLMAKATPTQAWLWHRSLSYLNFDYINLLLKKDILIGLSKLKYVKDQLCSSCELSKAKRSSFKSKVVLSSKGRLNLLHMDLCGPMRVASINGKKTVLLKDETVLWLRLLERCSQL
nr:retrovirus-related Pol polyprotein from transposon TNT 1-94 [Tanacetum cinerariifolium]